MHSTFLKSLVRDLIAESRIDDTPKSALERSNAGEKVSDDELLTFF